MLVVVCRNGSCANRDPLSSAGVAARQARRGRRRHLARLACGVGLAMTGGASLGGSALGREAFSSSIKARSVSSSWQPWGSYLQTSRRIPHRHASPVVMRQQATTAVVPDSLDMENRRQLQALISKYRAKDTTAWWNLSLTAALWSLAMYLMHITCGHWLSVCFVALAISRWFMVFHDASHLSFFETMRHNERLAQVSQFFVNYSWRYWAAVHNSHHAHFGDSTVKDNSLTIWFSEEDLRKAPWYLRAAHRIIREPIIFYPLASFFVFFVNKPFTHGPMRLVLPLLLWLVCGPQTVFWYLVAAWIAGMIGVASFHLQHHCNQPYRVPSSTERSSLSAALHGSTRIPVPFPWSVFSMGIEYHHIHHWDVRVPGYNLRQCDAEGGKMGLWEAGGVNTVGPWRAFKSLFHTQFAGSRKVTDEAGNPPEFKSFWPYSILGLQDDR